MSDSPLTPLVREIAREVIAELRPMILRDDPWIGREKFEAEFGRKFRCVLDAAKRGEITVCRLGGDERGRPVVRRSELDRWIESNCISSEKRRTESNALPHDDDGYRAAVVAISGRRGRSAR